jgi:hypothetical protein
MHCRQKQESASRHASICSDWVFSEDVVLGGLKAGASWFISDHLLQMDSRTGNAQEVTHKIADATTCFASAIKWTGSPGLGSGGSSRLPQWE